MRWMSFLHSEIYWGGRWHSSGTGETFAVSDPATGEILGSVPNCDANDVELAIDAAHGAFGPYSDLTAGERAALLHKFANLIETHKEALAELLTREQGKPLAEALGEVAMSAAYIRWFAEEARRIYGDIIPSPWPTRQLLVRKEPVGVVVAITPWNFPSLMLARKVGAALAAGCTVIAKPASQTPFSALALAHLAAEAGFAPGVLNVLTGTPARITDALLDSPRVAKLTFTGSTAVGKMLLSKAASTVKRVSLELGGNAPFIVFDDADMDMAIKGAMASKFRNGGQTCVCSNRIYVQNGIHDAFLDAFVAAVARIRVGNGLDDNVTQGPLISVEAANGVAAFVDDAEQKGARVLTGGRRHGLGAQFFEPTIIADATASMRFAQEEVFGPVAPVFRFETEEEIIALANGTPYGLAAYFYTKDLARAYRVSGKLKFGMVGINESVITTEVAPFGGVKESGFGSEGSRYGLKDYLDTKYVCVGGLN